MAKPPPRRSASVGRQEVSSMSSLTLSSRQELQAMPLDEQMRHLARLEKEVAQRAAAEARAAELVEQMRLKVMQFEQQNDTNRSQAEAELSRLSDDLQRSLHRQYALEMRVQEDEEKIIRLQQTLPELAARRDHLLERHKLHKEEVAEFQKRALQDRMTMDAAEREMEELDIQIDRLRREKLDGEKMRDKLSAEVVVLRPLVQKVRAQERAELTVILRLQEALVRRGFDVFKAAVPAARAQRLLFEELLQRGQRCQVSGAMLRWKRWAGARVLWRRGCVSRERSFIRCALHLWCKAARWTQRWRRGCCRKVLLTWKRAVLRIADAKEWRSAKMLQQEVLRQWARHLEGLRYQRRNQRCLARLRLSRSKRRAFVCWREAARLLVDLRLRSGVACQMRRRKTVASAWADFRKAATTRRGARDGLQRRLGMLRLNLLRIAFASWCENGANRRRRRGSVAALAARRQEREQKLLLPAAFKALKLWAESRTLGKALCERRAQKGGRQLVVDALALWRAWALLSRRLKTSSEALRRRRRKQASTRWRQWTRRQASQRHASANMALIRRQQGWAAVATRLRWWSQRARTQRLQTSRSRTVLARRNLGVLRRWFSRWDIAVVRCLRAACDRMEQEAAATAEANAEMAQSRLAIEEAKSRREELQADIVEQIRIRRQAAADLRAQTEATRAQNAELLRQIEEERARKELLWRQVEVAKQERQKQLGVVDPQLKSLEAQLAAALEVQSSLRFAVLKCEAEAERAEKIRAEAEARQQELRMRLEDSRRSYIEAIGSLDAKTVVLTKDGYEAHQAAQRLEKALESQSAHWQLLQQQRLQLRSTERPSMELS
eukprot:TRINITY_DN50578_c0_g1_i1.p1 TRINITY_DN50578_c0_g1~~TRINITY_DN50578_c0_g1_i1.p1  ORF type:complete len:839 (-),score=203.41 TRINITY_DN50578_c0_g1_i1:81-2597(-)